MALDREEVQLHIDWLNARMEYLPGALFICAECSKLILGCPFFVEIGDCCDDCVKQCHACHNWHAKSHYEKYRCCD